MTATQDRPWMTALEMQFAALRTARELLCAEDDGDPMPSSLRISLLSALKTLPHCTAFAWTNDTANAVLLSSRTIPTHTIIPTFRQQVAPPYWWWFESPLQIWQRHEARELSALTCSVANDRMVLQAFRGHSNRLVPGTICTVPHGVPLSGIAADAKSDGSGVIASLLDAVRFVLAACAWMDQRILSFSSGHIERHRRKQFARENSAPLPSDVKVIQLRRAESEQRQRAANGEPVDWSCRWIVNGHWRNQPYKDEHKLIYIMPFVKGPEDKPLRVPTHTVYQVSR